MRTERADLSDSCKMRRLIKLITDDKTSSNIAAKQFHLLINIERGSSVVVSTSTWHAAGRWFDSRTRNVSLLGVKTWLSTLQIVYLCVFRRRHQKPSALLSGVYARGSKRSHTGSKQTDPLSWTPHLSQPLLC